MEGDDDHEFKCGVPMVGLSLSVSLQVKTILSNLPKDKDGRIKVSDFLHKDIHAKDVFQVFDRNKDGYITKGELKLAKKNFAMRDIDEAIKVNRKG